jgi:hypothetical protein
MNTEIIVTDLSFEVCVVWPDCDVDLVYSEVGSATRSARSETPTADSVDRFLTDIFADKELNRAGVAVTETTGLIMGQCAAVFSVSPEKAPDLPRLIQLARERMRFHLQKIQTYKPGHTIRGKGVFLV